MMKKMRSIIVFALLFMTISAGSVSASWVSESETTAAPSSKAAEQSAKDVKENNGNPSKGTVLIVRVVKLNGEPSNLRITERVALRWQQMLLNNHIFATPFFPDPDQILFMFRDGSQAPEARDELIKYPECKYTILHADLIKGAGWREHHGDPLHEDL